MTTPRIPDLRTRFFRVHFAVSLIAVLVAFVTIGLADYFILRHQLIADYKRLTESIAVHYAQSIQPHKKTPEEFLENFSEHPGLQLICLYSTDGDRLADWQADAILENCPELLVEDGVTSDMFNVYLSQPIMNANDYLGMVYLEGHLITLKERYIYGVMLFVGLTLIALIACWVTSYFNARTLAHSLSLLRRQIACLKDNDVTACPLSPQGSIREIHELATSIAALRNHLVNTMVPKERVASLRNWYWDIIGGLTGGLSQRLDPHSPLAEYVNNYALLLELERGDMLNPHQPFNLPQLLDVSLKSARRTHAPNLRVNLTTSLQPSMPKQWMGQPLLIETLLRHLLLIGLKRTRRGFVSLRIEALATTEKHTHTIRLLYEDSGPLIQQWQLQYWLTAARDEAPPINLPHDISWLLLARLVKRLDGEISGGAGSDGGLLLEIMLPLSVPSILAEVPLLPETISAPHIPPLILITEEDREHQQILPPLIAGAGCQALIVESLAQASEVAPLFPFSAIVIPAHVAGQAEDMVRRLRHLMESGLMPEVPLWVALPKLSFIEADYWHRHGATELLLTPLRADVIMRLGVHLPPADAHFYRAYDPQIRDDLTPEILNIMPEMNQMLAAQIALLEPLIESFTKGKPPILAIHQAHAVKSAALALGYFRLAGLMDQIEHAAESRIFSAHPQNWALIAEVLRHADFTE